MTHDEEKFKSLKEQMLELTRELYELTEEDAHIRLMSDVVTANCIHEALFFAQCHAIAERKRQRNDFAIEKMVEMVFDSKSNILELVSVISHN